jgi:spermidine/putrescine transport system permease protein
MNTHSPFSARFLPFLMIMFLLFLYLPIAVLIIFSFNDNPIGSAWLGFTTHWYKTLFKSWLIWQALGNSLLIALCTTALSIAMGVLVVYCSMRTHFERFLSIFYINLAVPEIVLAVGLLSFFYFFSFDFGFISLVVSHTLLGLGYVVPIMWVRFNALDKRLIEASLDLGASQVQTFFYVVLPFLRPAIMTSALLVFVISFDNFILSFFCAGPNLQTLPIYIFSIIRSGGGSPAVNALSTILLLLSALVAICYLLIQKKTESNQ